MCQSGNSISKEISLVKVVWEGAAGENFDMGIGE
jgi:hypothetical protein